MGDPRFPPSSRYHDVETARLRLPDGREVLYLRRRFLPDPRSLEQVDTHRVAQGERIDQIAARYLSDPRQFWRICDGNYELRPRRLTEEIDRRLRITLPEGLTGAIR